MPFMRRRDSAFADAKVGGASCLVNLSFLNMDNAARARELFVQSDRLLKEAIATSPDNPRALWVQGANQWYAPPERGGGQPAALATYERGLDPFFGFYAWLDRAPLGRNESGGIAGGLWYRYHDEYGNR